jgi:hypothetical protein
MIRGDRVTLKKDPSEGRWWSVISGVSFSNPPKFGEVYTISETISRFDKLWLRFVERPEKALFDASYFRPVVSPKAEISFIMGAPKDSKKWDNRRREPAKVG